MYENTVFNVFICLTQRQYLQNTTKPSKPLKKWEDKRKKICLLFIICVLCVVTGLLDLKHYNEILSLLILWLLMKLYDC
jgi:hypothetical protein